MKTRYSFFIVAFLGLMLAVNPTTLYAQAQASADIQLTSDGVASTTTEINGTSGGEVVIEVLASGLTGP